VPLDTLLARHATCRGDRVALVFEAHRLTHAEIDRRANRTANALHALGVQKGDRVALLLDNSLELLDLYHAAAKTGIVVVPLSPLLRGGGLYSLLADADVAAIVSTPALAAEVDTIRPGLALGGDRYLVVGDDEVPGWRRYEELISGSPTTAPEPTGVADDDPFNIVYSSGTTGEPKGIVHTHRIREAYGTGFASSFRITPESVVLHAGSLVFNGSFVTLMPALYLGCTYVLLPSFDPRAMLDALAVERVTHVMLVPSQIVALLEYDDFDEAHLPHLEMVGSLSAPLLLEHKQELIHRLPRRLYELYGLTEGFVTILDRDDVDRKPASVGVPPPLYAMRILDTEGGPLPPGEVGEIVGRGPITMPGYFRRPALTAETVRDGWIASGDLGYVDDEGFLFLVDRKKDLVISGGVNVYPRDIEEIAIQHPDVLDVAVFGAPDPRWGESPVAAVRMRPGAKNGADELRDWINERVQARYQRVREVVLRDTFPTSLAGKTLRRVIREDYLERG
jgi:acyl-CoA synthetase (AMP-forming)/AMP-acid ligase II